MNANEIVLIILLKNFKKTKRQRALALQNYVQRFGALSQEAGVKVRELLDEVEE